MDKVTMIQHFATFNLADLREMNHALVTIIREKQRHEDVTAVFKWSKGDKVQFIGKRNIKQTGTVVECKSTRVVVEVAPLFGNVPQRWIVHASNLQKAGA